MIRESHVVAEMLAVCLQIIAALGWGFTWIVGPFALGGFVNTSGVNSWEFQLTAMNLGVVIFGWPISFAVAWIRYYRGGRKNPRGLLILTGLPYCHVALVAAVIGLLMLLGVIQP